MTAVRLDRGVVFVVVCQVVGRVGRHCEHLARVRVERNSRAALAVSGEIACQRFLGDFLQVKVNRGDNIVAGLGSCSGGLLGNSRTAKVGLHRAGACRAVQVGLERALQTGFADEIAHLVACLVLVRAAVFVGIPLVGGQGADRAEQVRGGGGVVLADGFALDFNALKICAVLLDIGDQIHRHIVRERVGRLIAEADRAHAVIDADHRAGIRKREIGRHAEVFLHIGAHGVDKLGRGDQLGRIHLCRLINGVAVLVGLGVGFIGLLGGVYRCRNRIQTERLGAVLHITRQFGQRCAVVGERRGLRDRQPVVDGRNRRRVRRNRLRGVGRGVRGRIRAVCGIRRGVTRGIGGSSRLCGILLGGRVHGCGLDTVRQIEQGIKPLVVAIPEGRVDEHERKAGVVGDERPAVAVEDLTAGCGNRRRGGEKLRRAADILFAV